MRLRRFLLLVLLAFWLGACVHAHPVQPTPRHWILPPQFRYCSAEEEITWPRGTYPDGDVTVTVECPTEACLVDKFTKRVNDCVARKGSR